MKIILTMAMIGTLFVHAENINSEAKSFYMGVGVSAETPIWYNSAWSGALTVGKPFMKIGEGWLGAESELTQSLEESSKNKIEFSATTLAGYATYIWDIDPKLYLKPRVGIVYKKYNIDGGIWGNDGSREVGRSYGMGIGIRFLDKLNLYVDYTLIENSDLVHLTTGVEYHF
jgi:hypothetical protein